MTRKLYEIAQEIEQDWGKQKSGVWFGARPFLDAMHRVTDMDSSYGVHSDCQWLVIRFLANAATWRGETARRVKKELKGMLK